jgi:hypothetical protein
MWAGGIFEDILLFFIPAGMFWIAWFRSLFDFRWPSLTIYAVLSIAAFVLFAFTAGTYYALFAQLFQCAVTAFFGVKVLIRDKTIFRD